MKKYLNYPIVNLKSETYLTLIVLLAPLLYFLSGINVDIYSPSMPTIASYFHASIVATKNTISITVLGWAIGGLTFGILIDFKTASSTDDNTVHDYSFHNNADDTLPRAKMC